MCSNIRWPDRIQFEYHAGWDSERRAGRDQLEWFSRFSSRKWLKASPESGVDCLTYAGFTQLRKDIKREFFILSQTGLTCSGHGRTKSGNYRATSLIRNNTPL